MTDTLTDLLPCPFCGGDAELVRDDETFDLGCSTDGCAAIMMWAGEELDELANAMDSWNRRSGTLPSGVKLGLHGPYGWLNGHRALSEDSWTLENDPLENTEEYFAIPLYATVDPFKEIGKSGPPYLSCLSSAPPVEPVVDTWMWMHPQHTGGKWCVTENPERDTPGAQYRPFYAAPQAVQVSEAMVERMNEIARLYLHDAPSVAEELRQFAALSEQSPGTKGVEK